MEKKRIFLVLHVLCSDPPLACGWPPHVSAGLSDRTTLPFPHLLQKTQPHPLKVLLEGEGLWHHEICKNFHCSKITCDPNSHWGFLVRDLFKTHWRKVLSSKFHPYPSFPEINRILGIISHCQRITFFSHIEGHPLSWILHQVSVLETIHLAHYYTVFFRRHTNGLQGCAGFPVSIYSATLGILGTSYINV